MRTAQIARGIALLGTVFYIGFGLWAFVDPRGFFDELATFPPYNEHLIHDVGAFQVGLGTVLLLALLRWSALPAVLGGVALGSVFHVISHVIDRDQGGKDSDPWLLGLLAVILVAGAVVAWADQARGARR